MKKRFTILIAALMLLTMITQPTRLWGQSVTLNFTSNTWSLPTDYTTGTVNYTDSGTGKTITMYAASNGWKFSGTAPNGANLFGKNGSYLQLPAFDFPVKKIVVVGKSGASSSVTQNIFVGNTAVSTSTTGATGTYTYNINSSYQAAGNVYRLKVTSAHNTQVTQIKVYRACTVTYNANGGSGTMTDSNSPYAEGDEVTLKSNTFTAPSGYTFNGWLVKDASNNTITVTNNKFTMPASNVTVTAQWSSSGDYITVSPTTATPTCAAQDVEFSIETDQTLGDNLTVFYTTSAGTSSTTAPDWIGVILYDEGELIVEVKQNKTSSARTAYFRVESATVQSDVITITQAAFTLPAPSFDPESGAVFLNEDVVLLESDTTGATIYYTMGATPADPTTSSLVYDPEEGIVVNESTTIKAIAVKYNISSAVATANYTVVNPLTTMDAIFTASATTNSYYVTLGNWVVSGVSGKTSYVTDNAGKGFIAYYNSSSGTGFAVGNVLSGTVQAALTRYNGAAEFTNLTTGTSGIGVTTGGTVSAITNKTIADLSGVCTGGVYTLNGLTYNSSTQLLSDGVNTIKPFNQLYSGMSFTNGKTYNVTGIYCQYGETKEILPRSSADIVEAPGVTASVTSISDFTYNVGGGPDVKSFTVSGANLTDDLTVTASANYKVCKTSDGTYASSVSYEPTTGTVASTTVYIRLEAGLSSDTYEGTVTVASTGAVSKEIALTGTVTHVIAYDGSLPTGCSVSSEPNGAQVAGESVSLTATAGDGYKFSAWDVYKTGEESTKVIVTDNAFTMPAYNVTVSATFVPAYTVTYVANGGSGTMTDENSPYIEGAQVTLLSNTFTYAGHTWSSWSVKDASQNDVEVSEGKFTMPASNVTVTAQWNVAQYNVALSSVANVDLLASYGASSTITEGDNADVDCGTEITLSATNMTAGKVFIWAITDDEDNDVTDDVLNGDVLTVPAYDITIGGQIAELFFQYSGELTEGDYIIAYTTGGGTTYVMKNTISSSRLGYETLTPSDNQIISTDASDYLWHIAPSAYYDGFWTIYNSDESKYAASNGTDKQAALMSSSDITNETKAAWSVEGSSTYDFINKYKADNSSNYKYLRNNTTSGFAVYQSGTGGANVLYKKAVGNKHSVTIATGITNGSVEASPSKAYEGQSVTLTAEPSSGYMLDSWDVYKTGDASTKITVKNNSFVMPGYDVTVSATFRVQHTYTLVDGSTVTLVPGKHYLIASTNSTNYYVMGAQNDNVRSSVPASLSGSKILEHTDFYEVVISGSGTAAEPYTMYSVRDEGYMYSTGASKANIGTRTDNVTTNPTYGQWTISISSGTATITSKAGTGYTDFEYNHNGGSNPRFACYSSGQTAVKLYVRDGDTDLEFHSNTSLESPTLSASNTMTVESGSVLTLTGTPSCSDASWLVVKDGGQLIFSTPAKAGSVKATLKKEIVGFGGDNTVQTGWYTIASPLTTDFTPNTDMLTATYDLYYYDEEGMKWKNYRQVPFEIAPEKGYLYANTADKTISFAGDVLASDATVTKALSFAAVDDNVKGFNLMGNPFTCNITNSSNVKIGGDAFSAYYIADGTITAGQNLIACNLADREIKPCEGFIVQATAVSQNLEFNPVADPGKRGETKVKSSFIRIEAGNEDFMDRAYVQLGEGNTLRKMTINDNVAQVYVMNDGKDYAAATIAEAQGEMPVNFKASQDGQYTITVNSEDVEMGYLHLIDNIAGKDVDLLANPSYSFNARTDDYESRFRLVFSANMTNAEMGEDFAFMSDGQLLVTGEGTLQVVDMMGRVISSEMVNGSTSKTIDAKAGVYVLRLINGENVKTQKMVIR